MVPCLAKFQVISSYPMPYFCSVSSKVGGGGKRVFPPHHRECGGGRPLYPLSYAYSKVAIIFIMSNLKTPFPLHWKIQHSRMYKAVSNNWNPIQFLFIINCSKIKFDLFRGLWILVEVFNGHTVPLPLLYQTSFRVRLCIVQFQMCAK